MDRETLRELQRPLEDRYREDPGAASIALWVRVSVELETDATLSRAAKLTFQTG